MFCVGVKSRAQFSQCWQKWRATEWFIFSPFLCGLYAVTPNSNQNLIFPHDSPSLRVNFQNIPCHIFFNFYCGSVSENCRHIKRTEYKLEQRSRHSSALICILFPFLHSPVFSYWPFFFLPSCSLFFFATITITTVEALWGHPQGMKKASVSRAGRLQYSSDQYGSFLNYK